MLPLDSATGTMLCSAIVVAMFGYRYYAMFGYVVAMLGYRYYAYNCRAVEYFRSCLADAENEKTVRQLRGEVSPLARLFSTGYFPDRENR